MKINWKIRMKNPVFWWQILLAMVVPILTYFGLTAQDITSWGIVGELLLGAIGNPYVLAMVAISVWNAVNDPTTKGVSDSDRAMTYTAPAENKVEGGEQNAT